MQYNDYTKQNIIMPIRELLGDAETNYTDNEIVRALDMAEFEICAYCNLKAMPTELSEIAKEICIIRLNQRNTEGLVSQSYSGVSEHYINGYPEHITRILNRYRKIKVI